MRRSRSLLGLLLLAVVALLALPGSASAAGKGSTPLTGVFSGSVDYVGCSPHAGHHTTTGTWSVDLNGRTATATFDMYVDGAPHVAYTFPGMKQLFVDGTVFSATGRTGAGPLTITQYKNGDFTYVISPYSYDGLVCTSVTFPGHAA